VSKTLAKKLIYVIAALAMLAMLIPAVAVPVSADTPAITMTLIDPTTNQPQAAPETSPGWNVTGSTVQIAVTGGTVTKWALQDITTEPSSGAGPADWVGVNPNLVSPIPNPVQVSGVWGGATIKATLSDNTTLMVEKKWGQIDHTDISSSPAGFSPVTWNESNGKGFSGNATITDTVTGAFYMKDVQNALTGSHIKLMPAQGAILNWFIVAGNVAVPMAAGEAADLYATMVALQTAHPSQHVTFGNTKTFTQTVSNGPGVTILASGEEAVQIVVVPEYPYTNPDGTPAVVDIPVTPEVIPYDFYTTEPDVVPQVRWAGEKIVLEKNFGVSFHNPDVGAIPLYLVRFAQTDPHAILEAIGDTYLPLGGGNFSNTPQSVWTTVDANGFASVVLYDEWQGQINVACTLYVYTRSNEQLVQIGNQHAFTVYYLKLESLTLGDVQGKREFHNDGPWQLPSTVQPTNPWDPAGVYGVLSGNNTIPDMTTQDLNVSQDALLRARVKGWFMGTNDSNHPARQIDPADSTLDNPASATYTLPYGRWILPDDWYTLGGGAAWQQTRLHWDIMCNPDGSVGSTPSELGVYKMPPITGTAVSGPNVIGPFSPGLELMTPQGWLIPNMMWDKARPISTVVPDGKLNKWDAPMPPAKIIFQLQNASVNGVSNTAGYFKPAMKTDIYYIMVGTTKVYTNPFYQEYIPAHEALVGAAFSNNIAYDWNSFITSYGPYTFWEFINQHTYLPIVQTTDPSGHPTIAEVYSDNHGEAMVWLNGNWNLNLDAWSAKGFADIPINTIVGHTTIQATADYPYTRIETPIQSNIDVKTWRWGGQVLGPDTHLFGDNVTSSVSADTRMVLSAGNYDGAVTGTFPYQAAQSNDKVVWVWVTDRDGGTAGVLGAKVTWTLNDPTAAKINTTASGWLSHYNDVTKGIFLDHGFLADASITTPAGPFNNTAGFAASSTVGSSVLRLPTATEKALFDKFWGTPPAPNPAPPYNGGTSSIRANHNDYCVAAIDIVSLIDYTGHEQVTIEITSHDFDAIMGNTTPGTLSYKTNIDFNAIDALDDGIRTGDANYDGIVNIGDVTAVERMILGYSPVASNAILNAEGTVDMGTVVKIERKILGLP
jgi:hypothetical protein